MNRTQRPAVLRMLLLLAAALLGASSSYAQQLDRPIFQVADRAVDGKGLRLLSVSRALSLDVDVAAFRAAAGPTMMIKNVPLANGLTVSLDLREQNLIEPGAKLVVGTPYGEKPLSLTVRMYKGTVVGDEKSDVFLAVSDDHVIGHVNTYDKSYEISTDANVGKVGTTLAAISYPVDALPGDDMKRCGVTTENMAELLGPDWKERLEDYKVDAALQTSAGAAGEVEYSVAGAWDADPEYIALFPTEQAAADYMVALIGEVSSVYERDLSCQLTIGHMKMWQSGAQGYPYLESQVMSQALRQAREFWKGEAGDRGFAHVFSGKAWVNPIGIAYLDVLCGLERAVCYSAITYNNPARDRKVVAHETGHSFGAKHTHDCSWNAPENGGAIDKCAPAEGGTCFAQTEQSVGTIMSYCNASELRFHPLVQAKLKEKIFNRTQGNDACVKGSRLLSIRPGVIVFPTADLSVERDTTITAFFRNDGFSTITIDSVIVEGTNIDEFEILEGRPGKENKIEIEKGDTAGIKVKYKARSEQPAELHLTFLHNGLNPPVKVIFQGYASDARPKLIFSTDFDEIHWDWRLTGSKSDTVVDGLIRNFGNDNQTALATLYVTDMWIDGPHKTEFQIIEGSAPFQLQGSNDDHVGGARDIGVRFAPETKSNGSDDEKIAWLFVKSNSGGVDGTIDSLRLSGLAREGPRMQLGIYNLNIDFGDRVTGVNYDTNFTNFFTNTGAEPLDYSSVILDEQGNVSDFFFQDIGLGSVLVPNESADLHIEVLANDNDVPLGLHTAKMIVLGLDEDNTFTVSKDTIYLVINFVGRSAVPDNLEPDETFYATPNPMAGGDDLGIWMEPRDSERGELFVLSVTDVAGRQVYRTLETFGERGERRIINAKDWPSGTYYVRLSTEEGVRALKVTIAK